MANDPSELKVRLYNDASNELGRKAREIDIWRLACKLACGEERDKMDFYRLAEQKLKPPPFDPIETPKYNASLWELACTLACIWYCENVAAQMKGAPKPQPLR